jgi:tetratricopeptide (TPR) repeat protein
MSKKMNMPNRDLLIGMVVIVVIVLGYFAWEERGSSVSPAISPIASSTAITVSASTTAPSSSGPGYTIKPVTAPTAPDYAAPLVFTIMLPDDQKASLQSEYATDVAALKKNNIDFNMWIDLGDTRKEAGDYMDAAADWQYASVLYPANIVSYANLGDLYTNFLHNYPKAVVAYKQAIKNDPSQIYLYEDLYQLYTTQYPQPASVIEAMLQAGIAANPKAIELQTTLSQYQNLAGH